MQRDSTALAGDGNLDLVGMLRVLRQRAPLIAMCVLLTGAAAFVLSKAQRKQYTAAAQVLFRNAQLDQQAAGLQVVNQTNPQPQTDTNLKLATLPRVAAETAAAARPWPDAAAGLGRDHGQPGGRHRSGEGHRDVDVSDICSAAGQRLCAQCDRGPAASRRELLRQRTQGGQPPVRGTDAGTAQRRRGSRPEGPRQLASDPQSAAVG